MHCGASTLALRALGPGLTSFMSLTPLRSYLRTLRNPTTPAHRWQQLSLLLAALWVLELYVVQELTLVPSFPVARRVSALAHGVRLLLDCFFVGALVLGARRAALHLAIALQWFTLTGLVTYFAYFGHPISFLTLLGNAGEGLAVTGFVAELATSWQAGGLALLAALQAGLVELRARVGGGAVPRKRGLQLAGAYLVWVLIAHVALDPLSQLRTFATLGRMGVSYGYFWAWVGEAAFLNNAAVLERAVATSHERLDRLGAVEAPLSLGDRVVVLQVESLDAAVVDFLVDGAPVAPFLRGLRDRSRYYRARAFHHNGSADADFIALTALRPSNDLINWKIRGFPFGKGLPRLAQEAGYHVVSLHGATGNFFDRRSAYARLGFDEMIFREELEDRYRLPAQGWGVKDREFLRFASRRMVDGPQRALHFVITLTSHGPFNFLSPKERELFGARPSPTLAENYLDSVRYVDRALAEYVDALPEGTTLLIYGDHESRAGYAPAADPQHELVPVWVYQKGANLALTQTTRAGVAVSGELSLLDVFSYFHQQLARTRPAGTVVPATAVR